MSYSKGDVKQFGASRPPKGSLGCMPRKLGMTWAWRAGCIQKGSGVVHGTLGAERSCKHSINMHRGQLEEGDEGRRSPGRDKAKLSVSPASQNPGP